MITKVTAENLKAFTISEKHILILCDSEWNKHKELANKFRQLASDWEKNPGQGEFIFGEADVDDKGLWDFFKEWKVLNVPAVVYIWNDIAFKTVNTKTGNHNVKEHIANLLMEQIFRKKSDLN